MHGLRGAGTLFALSGGVFTPIDLAMAAADKQGLPKLGKPWHEVFRLPAGSASVYAAGMSPYHCGRR
jgi:hypothetical protein